MFVTSVLPYISRSIFSLFLSSFFLYRCVCNLFHRTPFFPSFFLFFFFALLFSTDKQCIVEMKIGCTAALRESLINFLIIRWSNFAIYAASRVKTTRGKNGKREGEGGDSILSGLLMLSVCYFRKILFVESCTCSRCTRDHFGSVMTMTLHRLLDSIRHRMIPASLMQMKQRAPAKICSLCSERNCWANTVQKFSARCILFAISFREPNTANISTARNL